MRAVILIFFPYFLCQATNIPTVSDANLIVKSDRIIVGQVVAATTSWGGDHKFIWTRYRVSIDEVLKGSAGKTIVVSEPGGELDGKSMQVAGAVTYKPGERVALFLKTYAAGNRTIGWSQGKYSVDAGGLLHSGAGGGTSLDGLNLPALRERIRSTAAQRIPK